MPLASAGEMPLQPSLQTAVANGSYHIFVMRMERRADGGPRALWSWQRLDSADLAIARGGEYPSLQSCFAAARSHAGANGEAPLRVNLNPSQAMLSGA